MNNPVRQHWVPQFYLKYFCTPETKDKKYPHVWIFSKEDEGSEPRLTSIRNICATSNLYSPYNKNNKRDYSVEKRLSGLEHTLSKIWPELAEGFIDFEAHKYFKKGVALFLATMYLRHPDIYDQCKEMHRRFVNFYDQAPKDEQSRPAIKAIELNGEVHELNNSDWEEFKNWKENDHHAFFSDCIKSQAMHLAEMLLEKRWSVIISDEPVFITSDKPLAKLHKSKEVFGFGTKGTVINFPLSPTRILVMDDKHEEPAGQYYPLHEGNAGLINFITFRESKKFMISHRNSDEILYEIVSKADEYERNLV